jgi:hypothetical protein
MICRSWNCSHCQPIRKRQLMAQAASGAPTRFITLTVNPHTYSGPEERLQRLAWAWRTAVKRLRREHPSKPIEYLAIVEATAAGEPHLHILFRGPFIPQGKLSAVMKELIDAPIVDIRRVKDVNTAVRYVAKYITKKPEQFGTAKRYWKSTKYELGEAPSLPEPPADTGKWLVYRDGLLLLVREWMTRGLVARRDGEDRWYAFASSYEMRDQ